MPRYGRTINGVTPETYCRLLLEEHNSIVQTHGWIIMGRRPTPWTSEQNPNTWSAVRWRATRLHELRQRAQQDWTVQSLPTPSVLASLPEDLYLPGLAASLTPRRTSTSQVALTPVALGDVELEPDLEGYTFGVELECFLPEGTSRMRMASILTSAGIPAFDESYNHNRRDHWKLTTDGSLGDYRRGTEIVSPILRGRDGLAQLRKVCKTLDENGVTVRRSCGMHVHVGANNQPVPFFRRLLKFYSHYVPAIDSVTSRSRRGNGNTYCRSTRQALQFDNRYAPGAGERFENATTLQALSTEYSHRNRFFKVNLESYWRHGTVEFRQHQGTISADKAEHWVKMLLRMFDAVAKEIEPGNDDSLEALLEKLNTPANEVAFMNRRVAVLANVQSERR